MIPLLTTADAAKILCKKEQTLRLWRLRGLGPRYVRFGGLTGRVGYRSEDIEAYIKAHTFGSTSEEAVKAKLASLVRENTTQTEAPRHP